jgi:hypothetical protein
MFSKTAFEMALLFAFFSCKSTISLVLNKSTVVGEGLKRQWYVVSFYQPMPLRA